jgi:hypothetical protein
MEDRLWEAILLHIARLTDPSNSMGKKGKSNLTMRNFPDLIDDAGTKQTVATLVAEAVKTSEFCRDWRNWQIAHRDLNLALDQTADPLAPARKKQVNEALKAIADILNGVEAHYLASGTAFNFADSAPEEFVKEPECR